MKHHFLSLLILSCGFLIAAPLDKRDSVSSQKEQDISKVYDLYISALSKVTLKKDEVKVPISMISAESEEYYVIEHTYYISANELRGFSIAIPKNQSQKKQKLLEVSADLKIKDLSVKQGIHIITLESI